MLPTLNGRLQTRIFMLVVFGGLITLVLTPILPGDPDYRTTYLILAAVLVLGIVWELIYHAIQQLRWEKDWPTMFGLITALNEGALVWLLLDLELVPGIDYPYDGVPFWAFFIDFSVIWLVIWVWTNGPMRVPFIRWRFFGGRII
ncbi:MULTISPECIES: hypothetical protein [unclassified Nocardioides]|uniref:hypothetical protein n=1 Tax=unclassified Nocardioides TaxID=2615069 RepID=UPI001154C36F|nr:MULTISPECIES: hypothetical protein [unclassified Nocardioides]TQK70232.1 hypothetical protein FBY23_2006 [Nocardioides sp. SLBN-35]WGY00541.1 hypothetical protein QI633_18580 [Nocardioides sp. QY071]